jgi:integrase
MDEQARLLEQANPRYPTGERNQTMLRLMLNTGLRLAEVTALKWRDIDLTTGKLLVELKGSPVGRGGRY